MKFQITPQFYTNQKVIDCYVDFADLHNSDKPEV
jgi:hypothetical protein